MIYKISVDFTDGETKEYVARAHVWPPDVPGFLMIIKDEHEDRLFLNCEIIDAVNIEGKAFVKPEDVKPAEEIFKEQ